MPAPVQVSRRSFLRSTAMTATGLALAPALSRAAAGQNIPLFNGRDLTGWRRLPRLFLPNVPALQALSGDELAPAVEKWIGDQPAYRARLEHVGQWEVVDGAIVGGQQPPGSNLGAYLVSERAYGDFELELEARPDWPADTGIMIRAHEYGFAGFQVLVDHRPNGGIGGIFGNAIGSFHAAPVVIDGDKEPGFRLKNLREGVREAKFPAPPLRAAATFADFRRTWRLNDWNHFRIRCIGRLPVITTWINGQKICELDTAAIDTPGYDPDVLLRRIGRTGHIAFEVHDVNPGNPLGQDRWGVGAVCRWKNISLRELPEA